jgi:hypothetical protein
MNNDSVFAVHDSDKSVRAVEPIFVLITRLIQIVVHAVAAVL